MATFEYKVLTVTGSEDDEEGMLNELGAEGWELVSVNVSEVTFLETEEDGDVDEADEFVDDVSTYYFKRAKG